MEINGNNEVIDINFLLAFIVFVFTESMWRVVRPRSASCSLACMQSPISTASPVKRRSDGNT